MLLRPSRRPAPATRGPGPGPDDASPAARVPPAFPEQLVVGALVGVALALGDGVVAAVRGIARPGLSAAPAALFHLVGLYAPPGLVLGAAVGVALWAFRRTPWMTGALAFAAAPRRWVRRDPEAFAAVVGALAGLAAFAGAIWLAGVHFATRYHQPTLAFAAFAGLAVALGVAALAVASVVGALVTPVARGLGPVATALTPALVALVGASAALAVFLAREPRWLRVLDVAGLLLPAIVGATYLAVAVAFRQGTRRRPGLRRRLPWIALATLGVVAATTGTSAITYGGSSRVRTLVERRSNWGLDALRRYGAALDRDGDGHAPVFGGGDCDDGRADVYPGASDPAGDGLDADCFAGDGTPSLDVLGDGDLAGRPPAAVPGVERPSFLLVTVDALRPDRLGAWGHGRETSPNLDALAGRSTRFANAVATSSRSIRSIPSMLTGRYPSQIDFGTEYLFPGLRPSNETVAEALSRAGWRTAVVMGTDYFARSRDFFQGFDDVWQSDVYRPRRRQPVEEALTRLDRYAESEAPFFLWVHLFNVHEPYLWDRRPSRFGDEVEDHYDTEVFFADEQVGRLLEALAEKGLADRTVVIVASDHGEAFGEHGSWGHSYTLYDEELRAPLLVHVPGLDPRVVDAPVGLHDVAPTMLDLAGLRPRTRLAGRSLVPALVGEDALPDDRLLFAELMPDGLLPFDRRVVRRGRYKLHWWVRDGTYELYDLVEDPGETRDLGDARPEVVEDLLGTLRAYAATVALPDNRRGDVVAKNRLRRPPADMDHTLDLRYPGRFTVLGYDLPDRPFHPGERIPLTFYFRVDGDIEDNLFFEVAFEAPRGVRLPPHFHGSHYPLDGRYLTTEWQPGEILRDRLSIIVPRTVETPVRIEPTFAVRDRDGYVAHENGTEPVTLADVRVE